MKMQLERTPQEKTVMAFNKAQDLIEKIQEIKTFMNELESHQSDLESIAEQINECHWIDARIGRDTTKTISMDIDHLEMLLMDLLDQ
jgi:archaellum component FlaC